MLTQLMSQEVLNLLGFLIFNQIMLGSCMQKEYYFLSQKNELNMDELRALIFTYKVRSRSEAESAEETKKITEEREGDSYE